MRVSKLCLISLLVFSLAPDAMACSCLRFDSAQAQLDAADIAFEGKVIHAGPEKDKRVFWQRWFRPLKTRRQVTRFHVYRSFKGDPDSSVAIVHLGAENSAACGLDFRQAEPIVVLAYRNSDGTYGSSLCTQAQFGAAAFETASVIAASE